MLKRILDISLSAILVILLLPILISLMVLVKLTSEGPIFYTSDRIGQDRKIIRMPKFRTMYVGTPEVATDLLTDPNCVVTSIGNFLRKYSLDELPQLFSVLKGDMSLVGPRPALYNQHELISGRDALGIHSVRPGITGLAQIQGRDSNSLEEKIMLDHKYVQNISTAGDVKILLLTVVKAITSESVIH